MLLLVAAPRALAIPPGGVVRGGIRGAMVGGMIGGEKKKAEGENGTAPGMMPGLIGGDGKLRDDFILQRQNINRPMQGAMKAIPILVDLEATDISTIDGYVLSQLFLSGYAKMSSRIQELNKINGMLVVIFFIDCLQSNSS